MKFETHLATSILAGIGITKLLVLPLSIPFYAGILLGAGLPDIDHPNSKVGRMSFGISHIINKWFGHRGVTHSIPTLLIGGGMIIWEAIHLKITLGLTYLVPLAIGITVGYATHLLGDFFSKSGIPLFSPFSSKRYHGPLTYKTGSATETIILVLTISAITYLIVLA